MFGSSPLDKSCIGPDCSSGRSSASSRFPVGITSLGDENQQIRIQLAVHKYNSSANSPLNSRCSVTSPFRHSFLNNPVKVKNYEGDAEGTSKNEKRNGNQYEGVGAFPTIHLKKRAVRYRPIRRFNDVKVSYPELPVSRFLSNLPEACTDLKSSTRSVLDVLEDLSGKNIHLKDDNGSSSKTKSKGLGGDYLLNSTALYKPLFVQKPKVNSVVTRDNTTQTFPVVNNDTPSPQNSCTQNDPSDARAEIRRKLAKQNNEILASLSSSISFSPLGLKRKIGKVLPSGDESLTDGSARKNPKLDHQTSNTNSNGISKSVNKLQTSSNDSIKINKKSKIHEPNSPISPNKDRLTTIFLDMQNTSPKVQMFQNNLKATDDDSQLAANFSNGFTNATNGFTGKNSTSFLNGTTKSDLTENGKNDSNLKSSTSLDSPAKTGSVELKKLEIDQQSKTQQNVATSQANTTQSEPAKSPSTTFQFGINTTASNFNSSATARSDSKCGNAAKKLENNSKAGKKDDENQFSMKSFAFGNSVSKPNFSSFQFGANGTSSPGLNVSKDSPKPSEGVPATSTVVPAPQFSFGTTSKAVTCPTQPFTGQFDVASSQTTSTSPSKELFAFGQSNTSTQQSSEVPKSIEKSSESNSWSSSTAGTPSSGQSGGFSFGQKPIVESTVKNTGETSKSATSQPTDGIFSSSLITNSSAPLQAGQTLSTIGSQREICTTSSSTNLTVQESKFSFTFGQKAEGNDHNKVEEEKSKNLFTFGQKSVTQESQNTGVTTTNATSTSQSTKTEMSSMFGQNVQSSVPQIKFGQTSAPQISSSLGDKSQTNSIISISAPTFSQSTSTFPIKSSLFGSSAKGFGNTKTPSSTGFKPTPATGSGLAFGSSATTQSTPTFGATSTSQATPVFGTSTPQSISGGFDVPVTTQSSSVFRTSGPTPAFGQPATTQSNSSFPVSSTPQPASGFGDTSTSQTVPGFGTSLVTQSAPSFGISSSTSTFGTSSALQSTSTFGGPTTQPTSVFGVSTTQSTPAFGTSTTQSTSAFGVTSQPTSAFGASTTQSTSTFGAPNTQSTSAFGAPVGFGTSHPNAVFGTPTTSQSTVRFGTAVPQTNTAFGASTFSSASATQQNATFGSPALTSTSGFGGSQSFSQPFENKPTTSLGQSSGIFGQSQPPTFSSGTPFNTSTQNNIFEQKPNVKGVGIFDPNKMQTPGFGTTSQTFNSPNKYSFGTTTSGVSGFTTSPPNTTSAPVFSFGSSSSTTPNTFAFGSSTSGSGNNQFAFKSSTNEPFKFGATTTKEGPGFGGGTTPFNFGGQMNNNAVPEQKPSFNFGSAQTSSSAPFSFGGTPSPSVFNFGASTPASSGSGFSFGTPTPGVPFGQPSTASPGAPFAVPGTFSIGSGSSQSRPRATSRPRRRP